MEWNCTNRRSSRKHRIETIFVALNYNVNKMGGPIFSLENIPRGHCQRTHASSPIKENADGKKCFIDFKAAIGAIGALGAS